MAKRRQKQALRAAVGCLLASFPAVVEASQALESTSEAATGKTIRSTAARLRTSSSGVGQLRQGDGKDGAGLGGTKEAAGPVGKKAVVDILTNLVFAGTDLSPEERKLGNAKSQIEDVLSEREITEFYWRQLSVSYHAPAPAPKPKPKPEARSPDTTISCDGYELSSGSGSASSSETKEVVVTFEYRAEGKGYIGRDDLELFHHTVLNDIADDLCKEADGRARHLLEEGGAADWISNRRGLPNVLSVGGNDGHPAGRHEHKTRWRRQEALAAAPEYRGRRLEILAFDADPEDVSTGYCKASHDDATNCREYKGQITVTYNTEGENSNEEEVVANVRRQIKQGMDNGDFVESMKESANLWENIFENGEIVNLIYMGPDPDAVVFSPLQEEESTESAPTNKAGIAIGVLVAFIIAALALFLVHRSRRRPVEEWKEERSVATDLDGDDVSYITADYNNLGARHSKHDVHQCHSGLCRLCNSGAKFLPSDFGASTEENQSDSELIEQLARRRDRDVVFIRTKGSMSNSQIPTIIENEPETRTDIDDDSDSDMGMTFA